MALGVEFVGIADELLFKGFGAEVLFWKREVLLSYILCRQACACMPFTYPGYAFQAFPAHELGTKVSMHQIGSLSVAMNAGSIREENAYVVEHGTLFDQMAVEGHLGMCIHDVQCTLHHLTAMVYKQTAQFIVSWIVLMDELKSFH